MIYTLDLIFDLIDFVKYKKKYIIILLRCRPIILLSTSHFLWEANKWIILF